MNADYDCRSLALDLLGLLDHLEIPRASIVGTSMGASTALALALAHPDRVTRLVLRAPSPLEPDSFRARIHMGALALLCRIFGGPMMASLFSFAAAPRHRPRLHALLAPQRRDVIWPLLMGFLSSPLDLASLSRVVAPTLLLAHPNDPLHPLRSAQLLHDRLPTSQLLTVPSKTYWVAHLTQLATVITSWVQGPPSPAGIPLLPIEAYQP